MIYSQHYCPRCRKYFNADMTNLAPPGSHSAKSIVDTAVRFVIEDGLPYAPVRASRAITASSFLTPRSRTGSRTGGKGTAADPNRLPRLGASRFSGYIAADELSDGPFYVLSIVDNRTFNGCLPRLRPRPDPSDVESLFRRFGQAWKHAG